jgi:hypothetical protein
MRRAGDLLHKNRVRTLQRAVEGLPLHSRRAMLQGLGEDTIIAGAYSVGPARCPGFAAYRRGARTGYSEFAAAWDRYVRGRGIRRARTDDVATLVTMLHVSLAEQAGTDQLAGRSMNGGNGANGTNGSNGTNGTHGTNGSNGANGAPAELEGARDLRGLRQ